MTLSSINLSQQISANVASSGIQSSILVGGTNTTSIASTDADIIYGFTLTSGHTGNDVKWNLAASTLEYGAGGTADDDLISTSPVGLSTYGKLILDATGAEGPTATTIVAIYYETAAANDGDITITTGGTSATKLGGTFVLDGDEGVSRSALLVPRFASAGTYVNFTWTATTDVIKVICLAKD